MPVIKFATSLRPISASLTRSMTISRHNSTASKSDLVLVDVNDKTGISLVTLNNPPVTSLNLELLSAFSKTLDELKANNSRGMILTSSASKVFTAGLDVNEMYKPEKKRGRDFYRTVQDCWLKLYGSPFATSTAINGHSPAGGCLFAMCCEHRVMLPKYKIGLNETALGIVAPFWFMATMRNTIPNRVAEMALTQGILFSTDEALKIGLIDEIAKDKEEAIKKCEEFLLKYQKIPSQARSITKLQLRGPAIKELEETREADLDMFEALIKGEKLQKNLGKYIAFLKWKKRLKPLLNVVGKIQKLFKPKKKN